MMSTPLGLSVFLTIGFAALVTYGLRVGGLMLADRLPHTGRWKRFFDALPGTILVSLIAPATLSAGWFGAIGTLATALCVYKTRNVILSILLGMAIVAIHRQF